MSAPIGYTCPMIDSVIEDIEQVILYLKEGLDAEDRETKDSKIDDSIDILDNLFGYRNSQIENIRDANGILRRWGESLEEEIQELKQDHEIEIEKLNKTIVSLEDENVSLQNKLNKL